MTSMKMILVHKNQSHLTPGKTRLNLTTDDESAATQGAIELLIPDSVGDTMKMGDRYEVSIELADGAAKKAGGSIFALVPGGIAPSEC